MFIIIRFTIPDILESRDDEHLIAEFVFDILIAESDYTSHLGSTVFVPTSL